MYTNILVSIRIRLFPVCLLLLTLNGNLHAQYLTHVYLKGTDNADVSKRMQDNASIFLTELTYAYMENRTPKFSEDVLTKDAQNAIEALWETSPIKCQTTQIVENVLQQAHGNYQVRNIPIFIRDQATDEHEKDAVIVFKPDGTIDNFFIAIANNSYQNIIEYNKSVDDLSRRLIILDFIENFRTAYNRKDTALLNKLFSEDALIITGKVIKVHSTGNFISSQMDNEKIEYHVQTKKDYLRGLKRVFENNDYINVKFDSINVLQNPQNKYFYGVTLKQVWNSAHYSDVGYVFLLIDFRTEDSPLIQYRTWQPLKFKGRQLSKNDIFGFGDFILP